MRVATYAAWIDAVNVRRACEVAVALDASIVGAGVAGDAQPIALAF